MFEIMRDVETRSKHDLRSLEVPDLWWQLKICAPIPLSFSLSHSRHFVCLKESRWFINLRFSYIPEKNSKKILTLALSGRKAHLRRMSKT
jgi:hypothetical protein